MKSVIASLLMLMFASGAVAAEQAYVLTPITVSSYGDQFVEPCPQTPDIPVPANGYCFEGRECPGGYDATPKMCWDGGSLHKCGVVCENSAYKTGNGN